MAAVVVIEGREFAVGDCVLARGVVPGRKEAAGKIEAIDTSRGLRRNGELFG